MVEILKIALVRESRAPKSKTHLALPFHKALLEPRGLHCPPRQPLAPAPPSSVTESSAQGKLQSGKTGRAARGQQALSSKEPASPQPVSRLRPL